MTDKNDVLHNKAIDQDYGKNPSKVRDTDKYVEEYVHKFVEKWDELIDWKARSKGEGRFFVDELKKRQKHKILDVATGTGYHSVRLLNNGFDVWSADGSPVMLAKAFENAKKHGHILKALHADWRWLNRDVHGRFDAIICLGNSFTHLFSDNDRRKALAEFYSALKHDGILIIDHRNYDSILDKNEFTNQHTYYYAGDQVSAVPEHVDEGLARFKYTFPDQSEFHLNMYPLRQSYMNKLLKEVGFQNITTYGDFEESYHTSDPDFYVHIAEKKYLSE
jgi:sarcosine/dimethylglycine N-methyltransferase